MEETETALSYYVRSTYIHDEFQIHLVRKLLCDRLNSATRPQDPKDLLHKERISGLGEWSPNGDFGRSPARFNRSKHVINATNLSAKDLHCAWSEL